MTAQILAIDDSRTIRTLLSVTLEKAGFRVTTAVDGQDGLDCFGAAHTDLVITDINMPRKNGFEVIEGIRNGEMNRAVPILVLTTEIGPELEARARDAGATGWIVKPFDDASIVTIIKRLTAH